MDDCITLTGEILPWAREIISAMNSYAEVSPSKTGVKIWVKRKAPARKPLPDEI